MINTLDKYVFNIPEKKLILYKKVVNDYFNLSIFITH